MRMCIIFSINQFLKDSEEVHQSYDELGAKEISPVMDIDEQETSKIYTDHGEIIDDFVLAEDQAIDAQEINNDPNNKKVVEEFLMVENEENSCHDKLPQYSINILLAMVAKLRRNLTYSTSIDIVN